MLLLIPHNGYLSIYVSVSYMLLSQEVCSHSQQIGAGRLRHLDKTYLNIPHLLLGPESYTLFVMVVTTHSHTPTDQLTDQPTSNFELP